FFFQAEDGIRDFHVTGVQTCALPISLASFITSLIITFYAIPVVIRVAEIKHLFDEPDERKLHKSSVPTLGGLAIFAGMIFSLTRSEERRVGKECRCRGEPWVEEGNRE